MKETKCEVEVFSRVTGFFRPVQSWNKGKVEEFKDRKKFEIEAGEMDCKNDLCGITEIISG
jgi:ribonucleoside-triphosphate reductase (formate)